MTQHCRTKAQQVLRCAFLGWMALIICFATHAAGQVSDAQSGVSGPRRQPSPAPIPADRSGWYDIRLRDRELAQRLAAERHGAGFEIGGLVQHRILEPVYGQSLPAISEKANKYFHEPGVKFSMDRVKPNMYHLMTPAPVNKEWFRLMQIEYTPEAMKRPPMLVYQIFRDTERNGFQYRLLGVERVQDKTDPFYFLRGWMGSSGVHPLEDITKDLRQLH
ncbi:uncharacterized protein PAN0_017d5517 [Moesziomyces antarcticus]|uniref:Uncharacterized protein n=2 Tax=Pseudozyma antarctica TaxID=84753 RepID=A0A081CKU4_PSEA2|nr:uncharacterized protein PAN0_017d5517 [Moesziomyces antarcticus]GAK67290.1 hypothetical protein PAN0_017d5517 [Moesziomyces antarcticus]SPO48098.1 uncharacterized protein PSANT_05786 [Moesziomyces antarcticus]